MGWTKNVFIICKKKTKTIKPPTLTMTSYKQLTATSRLYFLFLFCSNKQKSTAPPQTSCCIMTPWDPIVFLSIRTNTAVCGSPRLHDPPRIHLHSSFLVSLMLRFCCRFLLNEAEKKAEQLWYYLMKQDKKNPNKPGTSFCNQEWNSLCCMDVNKLPDFSSDWFYFIKTSCVSIEPSSTFHLWFWPCTLFSF